MTKEFKIGDKVCAFRLGNGLVVDSCYAMCADAYPIAIKFKGGDYRLFTKDGKVCKSDQEISLYHGHGTFQFIPEPEYTWQWLFFSKFDEEYYTSLPCKSEQEFLEKNACNPEWYERIEESKRPV